MESSWAENKSQPLLYSPEYLSSSFSYPGASLHLAPTIYDGSTPVAFAAAIPRRVLLGGRELTVGIITFLTAASQYKKLGYGIVIWNELVKRMRAAGLDGMVNYGTEGETMNNLIPKCCSMLRLPTAHICTIPWWSRMLQPRKAESGQSEPNGQPTENVVERFLELSLPTRQGPFARLWDRDEADWLCNRRHGSVVANVEVGPRRGMVVGYVMEVANAARTKCLLVEDVFWGNLDENERDTLVKALLDKAAIDGTQLAVVPVLGYTEMEAFHRARFRPSRRIQHAYLTVWNGEPFTEALPSMYLDVF
jgi:hypothetical protein